MSAADRERSPDESPPDTIFFGPRPGYGRALWAVIAGATAAFTLLKSWQLGPSTWAVVTAFAFVAAVGAATLPRGARLAAPWAWGAAMTSALVVPFTMIWDPSLGQLEGYAPWYARGTTIVCGVVILRHRAAAGWTSALLAFSTSAAVSALAERPLAQWGGLSLRQAAALIALQAFAVFLARGQAAIAALREEERARFTAIRLRKTVMQQRHREAERIRTLVTATLQRIAAGDTSAGLRREAILLEGELRDSLRGHRLAAGPVPAAARAARARGSDVVLLDDVGDPGEGSEPEAAPAAVLDWVANRLDTVTAPRATVRLATGADGRPVISFYAERTGEVPEFLALDLFEP